MKQKFKTKTITRRANQGAHRAARIALERYLPFDMDWDDVTIYRVFSRDNDIAYEYLSTHVGDMWGTDDSGNIYILKF